MKITTSLKYLRISPRKVRLAVNLIRNKRVEEAENQLVFLTKKAAGPVKKLLCSAVAGAENNFGLKKSNLYVSEIKVDEGPTLKRTRARARGRFMPIRKRTSHITLSLNEIEPIHPVKGEASEAREAKEIKETQARDAVKTKSPRKKSFDQIREKQRAAFKLTGGNLSIRRLFRRKAI